MCASCSDCCGQWVMGFDPVHPPRVCTGMPKWSHDTPPDPRLLLYRGVLRPRMSCRTRYFNGMNSQHFFQNQWKISPLLCLYGTHVSRVTQCYCDFSHDFSQNLDQQVTELQSALAKMDKHLVCCHQACCLYIHHFLLFNNLPINYLNLVINII